MPFSILEPTKVLMADSIQEEEGCAYCTAYSRRSLKENRRRTCSSVRHFPKRRLLFSTSKITPHKGGIRYTNMGALALKIQ